MMKVRKPLRALHLACRALLLLAALAACSESAPKGSEGGVSDGPAYILGTRVWDDSATTSYFHVVPSLDKGAVVDAKTALEAPGAAKLYAVAGVGWFGIGGGESPTITRYTLDEAGALARGESISLANFGVADLWDTLYIVSPTKAYYPDRAGTQLIVWNPTSMEVTGSIELPETARDGYLALYGYTPVIRGTKLLFPVGWFDWEESDSVLPETGLVVIDSKEDSVVSFESDARCGGITHVVETTSGDAYFVSSALAGAAHRLARLPSEPCALRLRAGEKAFDSSYLQKLAELTDGAIAGEPVPGGSDDALLRVFDEELATVVEGAATWDLTSQAAWRWSRWTLGTSEIAPLAAIEPSTADVLWFRVGADVYASETKADYSETTLIQLTGKQAPRRALTVPGFLHGVAQAR